MIHQRNPVHEWKQFYRDKKTITDELSAANAPI